MAFCSLLGVKEFIHLYGFMLQVNFGQSYMDGSTIVINWCRCYSLFAIAHYPVLFLNCAGS